jgi:hypothetical protein
MRLDLDKDQRTPVESDQIDLTATRTIIARQQRKPTSQQVLDRELLAVPAQLTTMISTPHGADPQQRIERGTHTALIGRHTQNATATNATNHARM